MIDRFTNSENGSRTLCENIARQPFVRNDMGLVERLAAVARIDEWKENDAVFLQGDDDRDVYLILAGEVAIECNGREIRRRAHHQHVGEMALIENHATRSATVRALKHTVTARIAEADFEQIANEFPNVWRGLASELSGRIRQWTEGVGTRNEVPRLFIGSSAERLNVVNALIELLEHDPVNVDSWNIDVFDPSGFSLESLEETIQAADFAVLVVGDEDVVTSRGTNQAAPRDNVIFELGLAIGALGRKRAFLLRERGADLKLPSDLFGFTAVDYQPVAKGGNLLSNLSPARTKIMRAITSLKSR